MGGKGVVTSIHLDTARNGKTEKLMARPDRFWDRLAVRYSKRPVSDEASYRRKLEATRAYFTPDAEVLEIGCGTGTTALSHAPFVKHIRATDFSAKMIDIARTKAETAAIGNVSFEQASIAETDAPDGSLDMVMAHSIFHLLPDWEAVIGKIYAMLKPGGVLVSSTTCLDDGMGLLRYVAPAAAFFGLFPVLAFFSRKDLLACLVKAGFTIEEDWQPGKGKAVFVVARKPR